MIQFFAVVVPILILFCGFSIDIGMIEFKKLQMQSAADAAALGAELEAERGTGNWANIGAAEAGVNGFTNGSNHTTVSIVEEATTGAYNGRYDAIQATITQRVNTVFMGALNGGTYTLTTTSSALMTPCVYTFGTLGLQSQSLEIYTGSLLADSCPVYATSEDVEANGHIAVEAVNVSGSAGSSTNAGFVFPSPVYNVPALADPLASTPSPTAFNGTCNHTSTNITTNQTINPGNYCKGLSITGATVTLQPGLYTITGGGTWDGATVTGTGVTLFFTTGGGASYGKFFIQNHSTVTLSAANDSTTGAIPATCAILVFADRNWTTSVAEDFRVDTSSFTGDGIWYLPKAGLNIWSTTAPFTGNHYLGVVADHIFSGGSYFEPLNNYSYVTTGNPFRKQGSLGTLIQ